MENKQRTALVYPNLSVKEDYDCLCLDGLENIKEIADKNLGSVVVKFDNLGKDELVSLLEAKRQAQSVSIVLVIEYAQIPLAVMLRNSAVIDSYVVQPLTDEEFRNLLAEPSKSPYQQKTSLEKRFRELEQMVFSDELTGIYNRRFIDIFFAKMNVEHIKIRLDMFMAFFDIDDLKSYNDKYGHQEGDTLLKETARVMKKSFRSHDVITRVGGDEFAVVLWELPESFSDFDQPGASRSRINSSRKINPTDIAARFQKNLLNNSQKRNLTISGSVTEFSNDVTTFSEILSIADEKLYQAKRSGKNMIVS